MAALEADMGPYTDRKAVWELTRARRILGNIPDPKNILRGNDNGKCTDDQLVLLGHSIYSNVRPISKRTRFDTERMTGP